MRNLRTRTRRPFVLIAAMTAMATAAVVMSPGSGSAATKTTKRNAAATTKRTAATTATTAAPTTAAPATTRAPVTSSVPATTNAPPNAVQATDAKPLVIAISTEPNTLDGQLVNDRSSRVFTTSIYETLLARNRDADLVPMLAESWEVYRPNSWRFNLRKNVKFHNGENMNADAVVFSFNRILNPRFGTQRTSYLEAIRSAEKIDEFSVEIITTVPSATLPIQVTQIPIVPPGAATKIGTEPIGTGPYQFVRWDRGRQMIAKRNESYWGRKPGIAEYQVRIIPDSQTALSALQAGEVDLVLDLLPEQKKLVPKFASVQASEFSYIAINTYKKELSDPRVHLALNYAIDKKELAETVYLGEARPNDSQHLSQGMLGYNADLKPFPYDPERAKKLLAEAGYPNGFTVDLHVPIGRFLKGEETNEFVAAQLGKVGIKVNLIKTDFNRYRDVSRIRGDRPGAMDLKYGWNSNEFFDGSRIIAHITCDGSSSKYCNPQVDKLMDEATKTTNQFERGLKYRTVWKLLNDDPYSIYLLQQNLTYGMSARLVWQPRVDDEYYVADMVTTK